MSPDLPLLASTSATADRLVDVASQARVHCFKRALPLLKPEGGILMLGAQRAVADASAALPRIPGSGVPAASL